MVEPTIVAIEPVLLLEVIMLDDCTLCFRVRDARYVVPPTETKET
jgi:hypothetical protein